ncbi:hypothetical protein [Celeribacter naphthalenivorans]|uniref:hypothetical protein n=1 Tax=Celeribacter naphthalenivorans TaxID=1614694 RepID=UPI001CFA6F7F|nr:hypothetical protein [Celeribacter naphthalenivorans]
MDIRVLRFFTKINAAGKSVDWVEYAAGHSIQSATNVARIKDLTPNPENTDNDIPGTSGFHQSAVWHFIEPHYKAWKEGKELPESGTALEAWTAIGEAEIFELKRASIRTVEDVATLSEAGLGKVALPNMRQLRTQAGKFLEALNAGAASEKMAALEASNAEKDAMLAEMAERLAKLEEDLTKPEPKQDTEPKPTRASQKKDEAA